MKTPIPMSNKVSPANNKCQSTHVQRNPHIAPRWRSFPLKTGVHRLFHVLAGCAVALFSVTATNAQVIQRITAPGKFYVDDKAGAGIVYNYVAYMISNNTATTFPGVYVAITNIVATNRIKLASTDPGVRALGALAPGQAKMAAFYLKGPSLTKLADSLTGLTNENHTIQVFNGPPGVGTLLASATFGFSNILYVTEALANKVTIITNLNPYAELGSEVMIVIGGDTGTIGGENSISFSPAVLGSWRPDAYELVETFVKFTENPTFHNQLYFDPTIPGFTNYSGQSYTNTFIFRAAKVTGTNLPISPFAFVDSGTGTKHTALVSLTTAGGSNVIYSATNTIAIVDHFVVPTSLYAPGGPVTYSVTFSNFSEETLALDEIRNTLPSVPANVTYIPGSSTYNGAPIADPNIVGQTLRWARPFVIQSNSFSVLTFQALAPLPGGYYTNSVIGILGSDQIDTTLFTTDNVPAISVFSVIPVADVAITKTGPTNVYAGANFQYTITVTNLGPSPADSLAVTDALPASVTFVSASPAATRDGTQVIWTNLGVLAANTSTSLVITVTAPVVATSLANSANAGSPTLDFNLANNFTPPVSTEVTEVADLAITKIAPNTPILPGAEFSYTIIVSNLGPSTASNVAVTDNLPGNVTFVDASMGGFLSGSSVLWTNLGDLPAGNSLTLKLAVIAPLRGNITNTASVTSDTTDLVPANNTTPPIIASVTNLPPVAVDDVAGTPRNVTATIPVLANDSDPNGDVLQLVSVTQTNGTAVVAGTNVVFSPATNFQGTAVLTYTVTDGQGGTNTALITISVTNRPPVALDDSTFGSNGVAQVIYPLANDSDPDGDPLIITSAVATSGILSINPGSTNLTFTPTNTTTVFITYTVDDGFGGTATATITVIGLNQNPVANPDTATTPVNTPVLIHPTANDTDADGDPLLIVSVSATNGTAQIVNGTNVLFTPSTNFDGTAYVSYTVSDGQGGFGTGLITITVTPVSDLAIGKAAPANIFAGTNLAYTISITNLGPSSAANVSVTDMLPANVTFVSAVPAATTNGNQVIWTNLGSLASGAVTNLVLTVAPPVDGGNLTNVASVASPTSDPNLTNNTTPPVLTEVKAIADLAVTKTGPASAPLPGADFNYLISVTNLGPSSATSLSVTDSLPANVTFVSAVPPAITNGSLVIWTNLGSLAAGGSTNLTLTVRAPLRGGLTNVAVLGSDTPDPNPTNNITPPVSTSVSNLPPVAVDDTAATAKNIGVTVAVLANDSDPNDDVLTITQVAPTNGTASIQGTNVLFTPATGFTGLATCGYTVSDGFGGIATAIIRITVTNTPPVANGQALSTTEDTPLNITLTGSDADGDTLQFILAVGPTNGTITSWNTNTGVVQYTPNADFNGTDSFSFRVWDGTDFSAPGLVTITVQPVNDPPTFNPPADLTILEDSGTTNVTISGISAGPANEAGQSLTLTATSSNPALIPNPTVTYTSPNATGTLSLTPAADQFGSVTITVVVRDSGGTANGGVDAVTNTFTVTVLPVNDPPTLDPLSDVTIPANSGQQTVNLTGISPGPANESTQTLTITAISSNPTLIPNPTVNYTDPSATGTLSYAPVSNQFGATIITVIVRDNGGTANGGVDARTNTFTITVTLSNNPPVANAQSVSVPANTATNLTLTGSDPDNNPLSFTIVSGPDHGVITNFNPTTGTLTYIPDPGYTGPDSFSFVANDGFTNSAQATVNITVFSVADVAVFKSGETSTMVGSNLTFKITVANLGPFTASNVVVGDLLPGAYVFVSANPPTVTVTNGLVTWAPFNLPASGTVDLFVTVKATDAGVFTNKAFSTAATYDPNPANNNGSDENSQVHTTVAPVPQPQFSLRLEAVTLNRQTGLYEQRVTVTNTGSATVIPVRLCVGGLTNNVQLHNAAGTDAETGLPFVQYNSSLDPGSNVVFRLEYRDPTRTFFQYTNLLYFIAKVGELSSVPVTTNGAVNIVGWFYDQRIPDEPRFLIEFLSTPGARYTIIYSDDLQTWRAATPSVTATSYRTQWYDDGPPKTISKPGGMQPRFYRVIQTP